MKTIAFFNNKGGVGKTSLVYHLAWMFAEQEHRVVAVDLDPQANLSGMFLDEENLAALWQDTNRKTIDGDIAPLFTGKGDISHQPYIEKISEKIGLLTGDLALSMREDDLSVQWSKCMDGDERAFRVTAAFARLIAEAGKEFESDVTFVDVGPNLGAINRAALIASDYVVIPLAPDLFSLQGLRNVGPTLINWRKAWKERIKKKPKGLDFDLPTGEMQPLGYIVMRRSAIWSRPVKAYLNWVNKIPAEYRESVLGETDNRNSPTIEDDEHILAHLKDYRSLMPMAQEANKPMFMLKPADGVIGGQQNAVRNCYEDFQSLAQIIYQRTDEGK